MTIAEVLELEPITRLDRDIKLASQLSSREEIRYLVDGYYTIQEYRKATNNQVRALGESDEPNSVIRWLSSQVEHLENQVKRSLDIWTSHDDISMWAKSIVGIGPVIAAGLAAHIDIEKSPSAGHIWRFAGLDPTVKWGKKEKRPWNASLKTLCWKVGESFVKQQNADGAFYGPLYVQRRAYEDDRNDGGGNAEFAARVLEERRIGKATEAYAAYSQGRLPPAHVYARAKRWTVKLFLSHWQHVAWEMRYGEVPPAPYVIAHEGHVDYIPPPNHTCL